MIRFFLCLFDVTVTWSWSTYIGVRSSSSVNFRTLVTCDIYWLLFFFFEVNVFNSFNLFILTPEKFYTKEKDLVKTVVNCVNLFTFDSLFFSSAISYITFRFPEKIKMTFTHKLLNLNYLVMSLWISSNNNTIFTHFQLYCLCRATNDEKKTLTSMDSGSYLIFFIISCYSANSFIVSEKISGCVNWGLSTVI